MKVLRAAALLLAVISIGVSADDEKVFFMELPPEVLPYDVGANLFAVVGTYFSGGAFFWMPTSGAQSIGGRSGIAISRNGTTIIGRALDTRGLENAAIWQGNTNWRVLGSFSLNAQPCDQLLSGAYGANDDGSVVVGLGWDGCRFAHAFRWEQSTGMVDLGSSTPGRSSRANNVSGNGQVVIGWQEDATGFRQAAKWVNLKQELIRGPNGVVGEPFGTNNDGSIIVGETCDPTIFTGGGAWKWTSSQGVRCYPVTPPANLPRLPYLTAMAATSDDGSVIGGSYSFGLDSESLIWLNGQGYFLKQYLRDNGYPNAFQNWVNSGFVTGVSADGRTLVGYGAGPRTFQGFVVVLPKRGSK